MKLARINVGLLALGAISMVAGTAVAAVNPDSPKLLLHVKAVTVKNQCSIAGLLDNCANAVTKGDLQFYHVQLLSERGDSLTMEAGIAGLQMGLDYMGAFNPDGGSTPIDIFSWSLCATRERTSSTNPIKAVCLRSSADRSLGPSTTGSTSSALNRYRRCFSPGSRAAAKR
jgi:hypothetical protein